MVLSCKTIEILLTVCLFYVNVYFLALFVHCLGLNFSCNVSSIKNNRCTQQSSSNKNDLFIIYKKKTDNIILKLQRFPIFCNIFLLI